MADLFASNSTGNAAVIAESTASPGSRVQLLAVTSNDIKEGQLQYQGVFSLVEGIAGETQTQRLLINPDGVVITRAVTALNRTGNAGVILQSTPSPESTVQLIAVTSNGIKEGQLQYQGVFSLVEGIAGETQTARLQIHPNGHVYFNGVDGVTRIDVDCNAGDIILTNADCAEDFDVAQDAEIDPGTVSVIDGEGALRPCDRPYDKRVAGVASGAGGYRPGIVLDRQQSSNKRVAIAITGKAYCKVDAQDIPIEVGDLLTTSPTPGHAMKVSDHFQAFGAVIGKALRPLKAGTGLIPILIALQ